jgi:GNAT superfamily N-acetyltransferase
VTVPRSVYYSRTLLVLRKSLLEPPPGGESSPALAGDARLTVREASPEDVRAFLQIERNAERAERLERYATLGYRCFAAFLDGHPIGQYWWVDATSRPSHPDVKRLGIRLHERDVYGIYIYVLPERRGRGVAGAFAAEVEGELARRGYWRVFGDVDAAAIEPRWLWATRGYTVVRTVRYRRVLRVLAFYGWRPFPMPSPLVAWHLLRARARGERRAVAV